MEEALIPYGIRLFDFVTVKTTNLNPTNDTDMQNLVIYLYKGKEKNVLNTVSINIIIKLIS